MSFKKYSLQDFKNGWIVGNFSPAILRSEGFEVAVKYYSKGNYEKAHFHEIASEITVIVSGEVEMQGNKYSAGDIVEVSPRVATDFKALADTVTVVIKTPSVINDKFLVGTDD